LKITKGVIRSRKSKDRQHNGHKKEKSEGQTTIYKTPHRKQRIAQAQSPQRWTQMLRKGNQFLFQRYYSSCQQTIGTSRMNKGQDCDYDKEKLVMVVYVTDIA